MDTPGSPEALEKADVGNNKLLEKPILLLDGGLGTTLEDEHNIKFSSETTPLWSSHCLIEKTGALRTVQRGFADAGANIILTATYQASFEGFKGTKTTKKDGIDRDEAKTYMRSAVKIARDAFNGRPGVVALSLGAYGATTIPSTEYSGEYGNQIGEKELTSFHRERLLCFRDSPEWNEVDVVAFETLPRLDEVRAAMTVMQNTDKPYWISCVFPNNDAILPDGKGTKELILTLLARVSQNPPYAIGINCTKVHNLRALIASFENSAQAYGVQLPRLVIYPDGAGDQVYDTALQKWMGNETGQLAWDQEVYEIVKDTQIRGKWKGIIVGGCCKTTPAHIKKLRDRLDERKV